MAGLGIPPDFNASMLLTAYAQGDWKHDFNDKMRAEITTNITNDIKLTGQRGRKLQELTNRLAQIRNTSGKDIVTAYDFFDQGFRLTVPLPPQREAYEEDAILQELTGFNYAGLVGSLPNGPFEDDQALQFAETPITLEIKNGPRRNYDIGYCIERRRGNERYSLISCLSTLTRGKQIFIIMFDAAACKTSEIGKLENVIPGFDARRQYEVYFLNSTENMSDPATKITSVREYHENVKIYFLKDIGQTNTYQFYSLADQSVNKSLYSNYTLTTTHHPTDKVSGTIAITPDNKILIDDIKKESEVGSAVINAVSDFLMNGLTPSTMIYFFLKRAGDWCQALCLLDKERKYKVYDNDGNEIPGRETSIAELEYRGAETMLLTLDRVLLAYGLTIGVNVMYSNVRGENNWLIYCKNADVFKVDDGAQVMEKTRKYMDQLNQLREVTNTQINELKTIATKIDWRTLSNTTNNILVLRDCFYKLSVCRSPEDITKQIDSLNEIGSIINSLLTDTVTPYLNTKSLQDVPENLRPVLKQISDLLVSLRNAESSVLSTIQTNDNIFGSKYPEWEKEQSTINILVEAIRSSRNISSTEYAKPMTDYLTSVERLGDTYENAHFGDYQDTIPYDDVIRDIVGKRTQINGFKTLFDPIHKIFNLKRKNIVQSGGVGIDFNIGLRALLYLTTYPIEINNPETGYELGSYLIDYDMYEYTVIDNYVVKREMYDNLSGVLVSLLNIRTTVYDKEDKETAENFARTRITQLLQDRFDLLKTDMLYNRLKSLVSEPIVDDINFNNNDSLITELDAISNALEKIVNARGIQIEGPQKPSDFFRVINELKGKIIAHYQQFRKLTETLYQQDQLNDSPGVIMDPFTYDIIKTFEDAPPPEYQREFLMRVDGTDYFRISTNVYVPMMFPDLEKIKARNRGVFTSWNSQTVGTSRHIGKTYRAHKPKRSRNSTFRNPI